MVYDDTTRCGRPKSDGRPCGWPAGSFTNHEGYGPCAAHGGTRKRVARAWDWAMMMADEMNVDPWDALLLSVRLAWKRVLEVEENLLRAKRASDGKDEAGPVLRWMNLSRKERALAARMAKAAIDAGVAERMVRQVELEGQLLSYALAAALDAASDRLRELGVDEEHVIDMRIVALDMAHSRLLEIDDGETLTQEGA